MVFGNSQSAVLKKFLIFIFSFSSCLDNNINYDFLNIDQDSFEKAKNLEMTFFADGIKNFVLTTENMNSFINYSSKKDYNQFCISDSILNDFNFSYILKDTISSVSIFSDSVLIRSFNNIGDSIFEIQSDELVNYVNEEIVELTNNVKLKNYENFNLETNKLFWNTEKKKLLSYDSVKIKLEDKIINGCGFYSDHNFENYKIFNISGVINIESD